MTDITGWLLRGFEGPSATCATAKIQHELLMALPMPVIGAMLPPSGSPPMPWALNGSRTMYAVWQRPGTLLLVPVGLLETDTALTGRFAGG